MPAPKSLLPPPSFLPSQPKPFSIPETYEELEASLLKPLNAQPPLANPPSFPADAKSAHPFHGGLTTGHERIHHLLTSASMTHYKDTRNGMIGTDFSTKFSAWLALGCITARQVHWHLIDFENGKNLTDCEGVEGYGKGESKGTAAVRFELLWRDYMRLCTRKFGPRLFRLAGFRNDTSYPWKTPGAKGNGPEVNEMLDRFLRGTTGTGLIDASQRELYLTGYTSNRARQNVASFLAKHLGMNWKLGAEWYECMLVDYDLSSNWGNWQYVAGVGNDPRGEARIFNPIKQAFDYDRQGAYVKMWVEETKQLDEAQEIFQVWKVEPERRKELGLQGYEGADRPLKKIDFRVGGKGRGGGGGGGKYGGSSRGKANGGGEGGRGRGGGSFGARGRGRGRGGGDWRGNGHHGRQGMMDKAHMNGNS